MDIIIVITRLHFRIYFILLLVTGWWLNDVSFIGVSFMHLIRFNEDTFDILCGGEVVFSGSYYMNFCTDSCPICSNPIVTKGFYEKELGGNDIKVLESFK